LACGQVAEGCMETSEPKVLERKLDIMKMLMKFESTINLMAKTNKGNTGLFKKKTLKKKLT
jgi:hypothetical protein